MSETPIFVVQHVMGSIGGYFFVNKEDAIRRKKFLELHNPHAIYEIVPLLPVPPEYADYA